MKYIGVKDFVGSFRTPFDETARAIKKAKDTLKERGERAVKAAVDKEVQNILLDWTKDTERGKTLHTEVENRIVSDTPDAIVEEYVPSDDMSLDGELDADNINKLENNKTYIEKRIVSNHHGIIGHADRVTTHQNYIDIEDIKTWKRVYRSSSFIAPNGFRVPATYMFSPIDNIQACNYYEAALQVSIYMYILWTYNKRMKPGKLTIRHIITNDSDKIIEEKIIDLPYLRDEVRAMFKHKKLHED